MSHVPPSSAPGEPRARKRWGPYYRWLFARRRAWLIAVPIAAFFTWLFLFGMGSGELGVSPGNTCVVEMTTSGGAGVSVESPITITITDSNVPMATLVWTSEAVARIELEGVSYQPVSGTGSSTFEVPFPEVVNEIHLTADITTAAGTPETMDYTLTREDPVRCGGFASQGGFIALAILFGFLSLGMGFVVGTTIDHYLMEREYRAALRRLLAGASSEEDERLLEELGGDGLVAGVTEAAAENPGGVRPAAIERWMRRRAWRERRR